MDNRDAEAMGLTLKNTDGNMAKNTLTLKELKAMGRCTAAIKLWKYRFGDDDTVEVSVDYLIAQLKQFVKLQAWVKFLERLKEES